MAFEVPKIQRAAPQDTASVGRVQVEVPNLASANAPQAQALEKFAEHGAENYVKYVKDIADTEGLKSSNEMDHYLMNALEGENGAKRQKGNPYEIYNKFEQDEEKKFDEIRARYADASTETKAAVERKLIETRAKFYDRKITARGVQVNEYEKNITDDGVDLEKEKMSDSVAHFDRNDPKGATKLEENLRNIYDLRVSHGLKNGSVKEILDEKGQLKGYDMLPSVKLQLAKDRSEGLYQAISNLAKAGKIEDANFLSDKYGVYLDAKNKEKVTEVLQKEGVETEALQWAQKLGTMPEEQALREAGKIENLRVQEKVKAKLHTSFRQMEVAKTHNEKKNYSEAFEIVNSRMNSGSPFLTVEEMLTHPKIKQYVEYMNPRQIQALQHMVEAPKDSNPKVVVSVQEKLFDEGFKNVTPAEFQAMTSGLNKADKSRYESIYIRERSQSDGELHQSVKRVESSFVNHLQSAGYVRRNDFGKFDPDDQDKITLAKDRLIEEITKRGNKPMSIQEENDLAKSLAVAIAKDRAFGSKKSEEAPKKTMDLSGKSQQTKPTAATLSDAERKKLMRDFWVKSAADPSNRRWPTEEELQKFMNGK
ncbi:MAG: hypothetical protein ACKOX6_18220 [Bdellovibrio sp.]